jgi:CheY-specific phosphatase CheX
MSFASQPSGVALTDEVLLDITSAGCRKAVAALSRLAGDLGLSACDPVLIESTPGRKDASASIDWPSERGIMIVLPVSGPVSSHFVISLRETAALAWAARLLRRSPGDVTLDTLALSALAELGNVACCAFLDVAARTLGTRLLPAPPQVKVGSIEALMTAELGRSPTAVVARMRFAAEAAGYSGWVVTSYASRHHG